MTPIILDPSTPPQSQPGGLTLGAAQQELAARGFDYLSASRMTIMLNDAKNRLEDSWEFPWLEAVISGPAPLAIPDLKYVLTVQAGGEELLGSDVRQLSVDGTDLAQTGAPAFWYPTGQAGDQVTLRTWPVSSVDLTVVYIRVSPELVDADDVPLIPARDHPLWVDHAVVNAYRDSDNFAGASALQAEIKVRLQDLILRYETRNRQHSGWISIRAGSLDD